MMSCAVSLASASSLNSSTNRLGPLRSIARTTNASSRMLRSRSALRVLADMDLARHPHPALPHRPRHSGSLCNGNERFRGADRGGRLLWRGWHDKTADFLGMLTHRSQLE